MARTWRALPPLDLDSLDLDRPLALDENTVHGRLSNGLTYFIRRCPHPRARASLALNVTVGSVYESDDEAGIAHILEHLAFRGTQKFDSFEIVDFLSAIGAEFGADQNACTSSDDTTYELFVPCDEWEHLERALCVLSEFAFGIRISDEDLEVERNTVLDEMRQHYHTQQGRAVTKHWKAILKGSKYEERMPIGFEHVIRSVSAETIRAFRDAHYQPARMALVIVGDFPETGTDAILEKMKEHFEGRYGGGRDGVPRGLAPEEASGRFEVVAHPTPQYIIHEDKEATSSAVVVSFVRPTEVRQATWSLKEWREHIAEDVFEMCLNLRLFRRAHAKVPAEGEEDLLGAFFSASSSHNAMCRNCETFTVSASCSEDKCLGALKGILVELARVRLYGFNAHEIEAAKLELLSSAEQAYTERDKVYSSDLRDEYLANWLQGEPVVSPVMEAQANKALIGVLSYEEIVSVGEHFSISEPKGLVVEINKPINNVAYHEEGMKSVLALVAAMEKDARIAPHPEDASSLRPEDLSAEVEAKISGHDFASVTHDTKEFPLLGAKQTELSNGMRVLYKESDLMPGQLKLYGFARGGLSQLFSESADTKDTSKAPPLVMRRFRQALVAGMFAGELGIFGFPPAILSDALAGKRVELSTSISAFRRCFYGENASSDFRTTCELIHQLFATDLQPSEDDLRVVKQMVRQSIEYELNNPLAHFRNLEKRRNYRSCYHKPWTLSEFDAVDERASLSFFSRAFLDPGEFCLMVVGDVAAIEGDLVPMLERYVGSIPRQEGSRRLLRGDVRPIPFTQPSRKHGKETLRLAMVDPQSITTITFPLAIDVFADRPALRIRQSMICSLVCALIEKRLLREMRMRRGSIYTLSCSPSFALEAPSYVTGKIRGDFQICFTCEPGEGSTLSDIALDQFFSLRLDATRDDPKLAEDIKEVLLQETRNRQVAMQENTYWQDVISTAYQSSVYEKTEDLDAAYRVNEDVRMAIMRDFGPKIVQDFFHTHFPEGNTIHTCLTLEPRTTASEYAQMLWSHRWAIGGVAAGVAALGALSLLKGRTGS